MFRSPIALLALALSFGGSARSLPAQALTPTRAVNEDHSQDRADIERVMADFHAAVAAHDGQRVEALSVAEGSTWFNVLSAEAWAAARGKTPSVQKVRHSSFAEFAKFVSSTPSALDPKHTDVQIFTDGTIATVYFKYVFLIDGKAQNHGSETWQLVKAADGWKIAAITYSSNPAV